MPDDQLIVGRHAVLEYLQDRSARASELLVADGVKPQAVAPIIEAAKSAGLKVRRLPRRQLDQLSGGAVHQGVALRAAGAQAAYTAWEDLCDLIRELGPRALVVVADHVQDPHNLGAIIRSAAAAGACGVVIPKDRACQMSPAVVKAAAGTTARVAVCRVTNLGRAIDELKELGLWVAGAATRGGQAPWELDLAGALALVVGGEHKGVAPNLAGRCDYLATMPLAEGVESLNASVAAAVLLFEAVRQRRSPAGS